MPSHPETVRPDPADIACADRGQPAACCRGSKGPGTSASMTREPLLILDTTLRVQSANRAFYQTFKVSAAETEARLIYELGNGQWDIPDLRTLLEDVVP